MKQFYIVDSSILPDVVGKVIAARTLLQNGEVKQVSEAVKQVGITSTKIMFSCLIMKWHRERQSFH